MSRTQWLLIMALILFVVFMPLLVYLSTAKMVAFNEAVYEKEFEKNNVDIPDRQQKAAAVIAYLSDETDILDVDFTEEEAQHMADVKKVVQGAEYLLWISVFIVLLSLVTLYSFRDEQPGILKKSFFIAGLVLILLPVLLFVLPFDLIFELFHQPLFASGSWVFEAEALLVNLFPTGFFYGMAMRIFGPGMGIGLILLLIGYFLE